jgi:uncharacterized membrane protein YgaE (UPF0421/DUF939 family)
VVFDIGGPQLSPDSKEAIPLAVNWIKANMTGGAASLLSLLLGPPSPALVSLAMGLTIALCYLFKVMNSSRTALAAVVIVMFHGAGAHVWDTPLERVISVVVGCLPGLLVTYAFHRKILDHALTVPDGVD